MKLPKNKKKLIKIWPVFFSLFSLVLIFYAFWRVPGKEFEVLSPLPKSLAPVYGFSPISGLDCASAKRRPIAVMLSGDAIVRPLSGVSEADIVFNMPVVSGSITRLMAVFVCNSPKEVGSVRSARHDFIPLARGLDAVYAHWGGSHFALEKLNAHIMDNLDALINPFDAFWRKSNIEAPHNGFTSIDNLIGAAERLSYRLEGKFVGYSHLAQDIKSTATTTKTLEVGYSGAFKVKYIYDPADNSYWRWRGGAKEIDKNSSRQVAAKNVVIMRARSYQIEGQYNTVEVEGSGKCVVYRNGEEIFGIWKKNAKDQTSKLFFYDSVGQEIKFVPGQIWVEVVEPNQEVTYK